MENKLTYKILTAADYDELYTLWNQVEQTKRDRKSVV